MAKTLAVFDMDGTLTDSRESIWRSYRYAARRLGVPEPSDAVLKDHLCGGLPENCRAIFGPELADEAVRLYREDYLGRTADDGVSLYPGVKEALERLKSSGISLAVATMKVQPAAEAAVRAFGLEGLFSAVAGADPEGKRTKGRMILDCAESVGADRAVMIGDCIQDLEAAKEAKCWFIAASYGYGLPLSKCLGLGVASAATPAEAADIAVRISRRP
ncbi:hypothetical protein AUQ37_02095 [Candidatus Methanomethylophilus sp. 1R26]|uniref:HAD family hydrolase n=1 Tax=Candidatus Methanomethylophilus sp. 1R26 TaxID=1769296 RepID=UPI000736172A|nr:HAD-IA family hydrolase [Candidatus Methanomethylophilus sp. 1R26]KUE73447.1 hypothetical protein AUQ37_02095 [Candidatus Methanomethylophilus sp. 1R26]